MGGRYLRSMRTSAWKLRRGRIRCVHVFALPRVLCGIDDISLRRVQATGTHASSSMVLPPSAASGATTSARPNPRRRRLLPPPPPPLLEYVLARTTPAPYGIRRQQAPSCAAGGIIAGGKSAHLPWTSMIQLTCWSWHAAASTRAPCCRRDHAALAIPSIVGAAKSLSPAGARCAGDAARRHKSRHDGPRRPSFRSRPGEELGPALRPLQLPRHLQGFVGPVHASRTELCKRSHALVGSTMDKSCHPRPGVPADAHRVPQLGWTQ